VTIVGLRRARSKIGLHSFASRRAIGKTRTLGQALAAILVLASLTAAGHAAILTEHIDIECRQESPSLQCDYRLLRGADLVSSTAEHSGISAKGERLVDDNSEHSRTAILFLVDTSDPARDAALTRNREHIRRMVDVGAPHYAYGLAAFDSNLEMLCEMGCSGADIISSTERLIAKGKTTELYRNVLEAIKRIRAFNAERRHIILMSDGLAEDLAYHHEDVIQAARKYRIVISSIGYPRSVAQSVALQTLRRLSEETGGLFIQASHVENEVPATFFTAVMSTIDNGGRIAFDLEKFQQHGVGGDIDISLAFETTEQSFVVVVPVSLPGLHPPADPDDRASTSAKPTSAEIVYAPPAPAPPPVPPIQRAEPVSAWFWYGLPAMVFAGILVLALGYSLISQRRRDEDRQNPIQHATSHAFLVGADNAERRYRIDHTPWRIGRSRSSDLTLDDTSVSRLHAEIRRDALGQFTLQDLESLNGVFVNGEPVEMTHLEEDDRVEIGDVGFIFTFHDEDYARQEPTVLLRTRAPTGI